MREDKGASNVPHPEGSLEERTGDCVRPSLILYLDCRATDYGDKRTME
jgi:hypothetical protein